MLVLGLNGSPRKGGNTQFLLSLFMEQMTDKGYDVRVVKPSDFNFNRCTGCGTCELKGHCVFKDDFSDMFLPLLLKADIVVLSTPVYFYAMPAPIKAVIDRTQVLWSRKYRFSGEKEQIDIIPSERRKGFLLSAGGSNGVDLFTGIKLTAKYFFDAAGIEFSGDLCYRKIDKIGDMKKHPTVSEDIKRLAQTV